MKSLTPAPANPRTFLEQPAKANHARQLPVIRGQLVFREKVMQDFVGWEGD